MLPGAAGPKGGEGVRHNPAMGGHGWTREKLHSGDSWDRKSLGEEEGQRESPSGADSRNAA